MSVINFEEFYRAIHGYSPFPWQSRAAKRLAGRNTFGVRVPTGLGKSSLVDAAIWAAAHGAWRRIVFVVDRRLVVDEVYERAQLINQRLLETKDVPLQKLREEVGDLQIVRLRGGVFGDDEWVLYPERLSIVLTTVDQLGSRLLFRGYGVSPKRWPMHAGFFSDDTLVVVDEAHLSMPFLQTLHGVKLAGADVSIIPMSATLSAECAPEFIDLDESDLALETVQRRLNASKLVCLQEVGASDRDVANAALKALEEICSRRGVCKVAIVVNRVSTARFLFEHIRSSQIDCTLLTGRIRPFERDRQLTEVFSRVKAGRKRCADDGLFVVVATQTIEVGADFDFDALISECAPLSALRQRFGRLDRLGQVGQTSGLILRRAGQKDDPIYGQALSSAWDWLREHAAKTDGVIDFGLKAINDLIAVFPPPVEGVRYAGTLLPTHIQTLSQTGPFAPNVDLTGWLHGPTNVAQDVILIWRDDLDTLPADDWPAAIALLPPMLREGLPLSVHAAKRFLFGVKASDALSDLEGLCVDAACNLEGGKLALCWRGVDDCRVVTPADVCPGDTLVLPASYGGCDKWGWAPCSSEPVHDLADALQLEMVAAEAAQRFTLRLVNGHWQALGECAADFKNATDRLIELQRIQLEEDNELEDTLGIARCELIKLVDRLPKEVKDALKRSHIEAHPGGIVIRGAGIEEVEGVIETGRPISLEEHHRDVARWAGSLSQNHPQLDKLVAAALVHDAGKAEVRMQNLLHGHPIRSAMGPVLAKSASSSRAQQSLAYRFSGLPKGFRHEFASLDFEELVDPLVCHLVATHHGHGRPWLRACSDHLAPGARYSALDSHWLGRWSEVVNQHGAWGIARLEWRLRAADIRASKEEAGYTEDTR